MSKSTPTRVIRLQANLGPKPLAQALRRSNRQTDCGRRALAYYLFDMQDRGVHQLLGFASAAHFAVETLDMKRRTARDLINVGRALAELPLVDRAFATGRISWTKLRLLARICVPETQTAWLEKAEALSLSEFERLVSTSEAGRPPREGGHGLPVTRVDVRLRLNAVEHELLEQVRLKVSAETGEEISTQDVLLLLAERALREKAEGGAKARTEAAGESLFRVHVDHCPSCRESRVRTLDGPVPIPANLGDAVLCEGNRSVAKAPSRGAAAPRDEGEKSAEALAPPASLALRRKILARDGFRCRVCSSKGTGLQVHHIRWRSRGGATVPENLLATCARCHALVHEGLLTIEGKAPHDLRIERQATQEDRNVESGVALVVDPPRGGAAAPPKRPFAVTFEDLPPEVDARWWRRHHHLLTWNDRRGVFVLTDGAPFEDEPVARPRHEAPPSQPRFEDVLGQDRAVQSLKLALAAARIEKRCPDPILLTGPAGVGKTTLARAVASKLERRAVDVSAPVVEHPASLMTLVAGLEDGDVLFIDEIHALPRRAAEMLYEALQEKTL
ncbi:MAG TPA: AAA family ATPase, partial [Planctomycetes bacterium]|nr:AAA family ATPase [Planctomycetota bacterium]